MFAYLHLGGCGKPAFLYDHMPVEGERVSSKFARTLDGGEIKEGDRRICGSCLKVMRDLYPTTRALVPAEAV